MGQVCACGSPLPPNQYTINLFPLSNMLLISYKNSGRRTWEKPVFIFCGRYVLAVFINFAKKAKQTPTNFLRFPTA